MSVKNSQGKLTQVYMCKKGLRSRGKHTRTNNNNNDQKKQTKTTTTKQNRNYFRLKCVCHSWFKYCAQSSPFFFSFRGCLPHRVLSHPHQAHKLKLYFSVLGTQHWKTSRSRYSGTGSFHDQFSGYVLLTTNECDEPHDDIRLQNSAFNDLPSFLLTHPVNRCHPPHHTHIRKALRYPSWSTADYLSPTPFPSPAPLRRRQVHHSSVGITDLREWWMRAHRVNSVNSVVSVLWRQSDTTVERCKHQLQPTTTHLGSHHGFPTIYPHPLRVSPKQETVSFARVPSCLFLVTLYVLSFMYIQPKRLQKQEGYDLTSDTFEIRWCYSQNKQDLFRRENEKKKKCVGGWMDEVERKHEVQHHATEVVVSEICIWRTSSGSCSAFFLLFFFCSSYDISVRLHFSSHLGLSRSSSLSIMFYVYNFI